MRTKKSLIAIAAVLLALEALLLWVLPKTIHLCIGAVCMLAGIALWLLPALQADAGNLPQKLAQIGWARGYLPVTMTISAVAMALGLDAKWHVLAQALPLAAVLIRTLGVSAAASHAERLNDRTRAHDELIALSRRVALLAQRGEAAEELRRLSEAIRDSDPVCPPSLMSYQDSLLAEAEHLASLSDEEALRRQCAEVTCILEERNNAIRRSKASGC